MRYVGGHESDDAFGCGVQSEARGAPACVCCTPSTLCEPVSLLNDAGHHRTVPFNLKSAGFKALC